MRTLLLAVLWAAFVIPAHAEMPRKDAVALLDAAVVELRKGSETICTAAKVGPTEYLSARHCTQRLADDYELKLGYTYQFPSSVTIGLNDGDDWAVLNVSEEDEEIGSLGLGCDEEVYLGMPVAYMGYPDPVDRAFSVGYVSSVNPTTERMMNTDFVVDVQASHGASGSPIISLDTGNVVGVLIEGVRGGAGFFMIGAQEVADTPLCGKARLLANPIGFVEGQ